MERGPLRIWNGTTWETIRGNHSWRLIRGGTVFKLSPSNGSWIPSKLYRFSLLFSAMPWAGVPCRNGILYGTTNTGGAHRWGNIFRAEAEWCTPNSGAILDWQNNLYGTTTAGGSNNAGVVFKLSLVNNTWTETLLHTFTGRNGRWAVYDSLAFRGTNKLLGMTSGGGSHGRGVVFELIP